MVESEYPVSFQYLYDLHSENDLLLDVGSKDGRHTKLLSCESVSIDINFKHTEGDTNFIISDGTRMCFRDNIFDFVYCNQVLEHVRDTEKLIAEIARVLKSDGKAIFAFPNRLALTKPHDTPRWYSLLPRPIGERLAPHLLSPENEKFYRTAEFMITPRTARRHMELYFNNVNYRTFEHKYKFQKKYEEYRKILTVLADIEALPVLGKIIEQIWHHASYVCSSPIKNNSN